MKEIKLVVLCLLLLLLCTSCVSTMFGVHMEDDGHKGVYIENTFDWNTIFGNTTVQKYLNKAKQKYQQFR